MNDNAVIDYLKRSLEGIVARIRGQNERVIITGSDDSKPVRTLQLKGPFGKTYDKVEHLEPFGFSARPLKGAEGYKVELGGDPGIQGHPLVIVAFDRSVRVLNLQEGEAVVFNAFGDYIKFDVNRNVTINAGADVNITAATKVTVTAPNVEFTGNVTVDGTLAVNKAATFNSGASITNGDLVVANGQYRGLNGALNVSPGPIRVNGTALTVP